MKITVQLNVKEVQFCVRGNVLVLEMGSMCFFFTGHSVTQILDFGMLPMKKKCNIKKIKKFQKNKF